jgi:uncharacterized membrane protein
MPAKGHMRGTLVFIRTTMIGGLLVLLPAVIVLYLGYQAFGYVRMFTAPITGPLGDYVGIPLLITVVVIVAASFLAGLVARTAVGGRLFRSVDQQIAARLPGYASMRGTLEAWGTDGAKPCTVRLDDGFAIGFVMEMRDGLCTVYLPSAPTPGSGSVLIVTEDRVRPIDAPLSTVAGSMGHYGRGVLRFL